MCTWCCPRIILCLPLLRRSRLHSTSSCCSRAHAMQCLAAHKWSSIWWTCYRTKTKRCGGTQEPRTECVEQLCPSSTKTCPLRLTLVSLLVWRGAQTHPLPPLALPKGSLILAFVLTLTQSTIAVLRSPLTPTASFIALCPHPQDFPLLPITPAPNVFPSPTQSP